MGGHSLTAIRSLLALFQDEVTAWVTGPLWHDMFDGQARAAARVVEEALELFQASGGTMLEADVISEHVWSRPVGEVSQELAGVMVSLLAAATANGYNLEAVTNTEIQRIVFIPKEVLLEKQAFKNNAGITKYKGASNA